MQVRITNVTDGPGKKPVEARVYKKRLRPGSWMDVPVQFVDEKVRKLEQAGVIVIGKLPPWYADCESRRKVRNLTAEEVAANVELKTKHQKMVAARKASALREKPVAPAPAPKEALAPPPLPEVETEEATETRKPRYHKR